MVRTADVNSDEKMKTLKQIRREDAEQEAEKNKEKKNTCTKRKIGILLLVVLVFFGIYSEGRDSFF